jgi:DNA-binding CsgD family transcriptional regulator
MESPYTDRYVHFSIQSGIVISTYLDFDTTITLEIARAIRDKRLALQKGADYLQLIISPSHLKMDSSARDYLVSKEGMKGIIRVAILVKNWAMMNMARFFMLFKKMNIAVRTFWQKAHALEWLLGIQKKDTALLQNTPNKDLKNYPNRLLTPTIGEQVADGPQSPQAMNNKDTHLTQKEKLIAHLKAQGLTHNQIAKQSACSPKTVAKHIERIYKKLNIKNGVELTLWWNHLSENE